MLGIHSPETSLRSIFDCTLSSEAIERILHFLSACTSFVHPQCYIEAGDALTLFGDSKMLCAGALQQFQSITRCEERERWEYARQELGAKPKGSLSTTVRCFRNYSPN